MTYALVHDNTRIYADVSDMAFLSLAFFMTSYFYFLRLSNKNLYQVSGRSSYE